MNLSHWVVDRVLNLKSRDWIQFSDMGFIVMWVFAMYRVTLAYLCPTTTFFLKIAHRSLSS